MFLAALWTLKLCKKDTTLVADFWIIFFFLKGNLNLVRTCKRIRGWVPQVMDWMVLISGQGVGHSYRQKSVAT